MKKALNWKDLFEFCRRDNAGRWYPREGTPAYEYITQNNYRSPSRAWPYSYAKPLMTKKFAKWLREHYPEHARRYGLN